MDHATALCKFIPRSDVLKADDVVKENVIPYLPFTGKVIRTNMFVVVDSLVKGSIVLEDCATCLR